MKYAQYVNVFKRYIPTNNVQISQNNIGIIGHGTFESNRFVSNFKWVLQKCPKCIRFITINAHALHVLAWFHFGIFLFQHGRAELFSLAVVRHCRGCFVIDRRACALMVIKRMHFGLYPRTHLNFETKRLLSNVPRPIMFKFRKTLLGTARLKAIVLFQNSNGSSRNAQNAYVL